jgi:heme exporter protein D
MIERMGADAYERLRLETVKQHQAALKSIADAKKKGNRVANERG